MGHKTHVVKKPWGKEYLVYENEDVALWLLSIDAGQGTSMHCHPKKTTGLIVLDGKVVVSFLADSRELKSLDKVMIRRGLFHSTRAIDHGALVFEIETPKDKNDLVRLNDAYGRAHAPYEGEAHEEEKDSSCIWIREPDSGEKDDYVLAGCKLHVERISHLDQILRKDDDDLLVFLRGGMVRLAGETQHCVTLPGDVGFARIVKKVASELDGVVDGTLLMTISK